LASVSHLTHSLTNTLLTHNACPPNRIYTLFIAPLATTSRVSHSSGDRS
jgi:hypothetical protein